MENGCVNLFIVGAVKGGTTWLYEQLSHNNMIYCPKLKEPQYFFEDYKARKHLEVIRTIEKYEERVSEGKNYKYRVDGSATYLTADNSAKKIREYNPNSKIIIMKRNKVDRAFSHYIMCMREGVEMREIDSAITIESEYVKYSKYENGIKAFQNEFPEKNILILDFEELKEPEVLLHKVSDFLEVKCTIPVNINEKLNKGALPKNKIISKILANPLLRLTFKNYCPIFAKKYIKSKIYKELDINLTDTQRKKIEGFF